MENYKFVTINSFDRANGSDSNFTVTLNGTFREDFTQMALVNFICTNTFYNVDSTNNTFNFQENIGAVTTATLAVGNYTLTDIITALETAMDAISANARTYTITSSSLTNKLTITGSAGTFLVKSTGGLNLMLGFSRSSDTTTALAVISPRIYNLSRYSFFHLSCTLSKGDTFNTSVGNRENIIGYIPVCESSNGDIYSFRPNPFCWRDVSYPNIDQLQVKLTDDQGVEIELNGGFMSMCLVFR